MISKISGFAEMWGLRPDVNHCAKAHPEYPEEKRERFVSATELRRIGEELREMEAKGIELPSAILAARLLIVTGCRLYEIMALQWAQVDLNRAHPAPSGFQDRRQAHRRQPVESLPAPCRASV